MVKIGGLLKTSFNDYPDKIAAVIFLQGCNMRCGFCHNPDLLGCGSRFMGREQLHTFLKKRTGLLDGLVVTGGEPTCQPGLADFLFDLKSEHDLPIKLDTNGTNPHVLSTLIEQELVDYVAMDVKTSPEKYYELTRATVKFDSIEQSLKMIKECGLPHEFRTTVIPGFFDDGDRRQIAKLVAGGHIYYLQKFVPENAQDAAVAALGADGDEFLKSAGEFFSHVIPCQVRT